MKYQNLFEQLKKTCNFIALEDEMFEIINAIKKDLINQGQELPIHDVSKCVNCDGSDIEMGWCNDCDDFYDRPF